MASNDKVEIEISGDTTKFEKSLRNIDTAISILKNKATVLKQALELDPTSTDKMQQLQKNLQQQLEMSKVKASQLKNELSGIGQSGPDSQNKWISLQSSLANTSLQADRLVSDIKGIDSAIKNGNWQVQAEIDMKDSAVNGKIEGFKSKFSGMKGAAVNAFREIGSNAVSALGNGLKGWVSGAMDTQKAMNSLKTTMNFAGNGAEFDSLSKRMTDLSKGTNANAGDTLKLASTFVGLGSSAKEAGDRTDALVKANQAFGGTGEDLQGIAQAYSQMSDAGKVTSESIEQLTGNNVEFGSAIKSTIMEMNPALKQYGSFAGASEAGAISVDMLDKAMTSLGKSGGGSATTIGDAWDNFNENVSLALLPALEALTPVITSIINSISDNMPNIVSGIKGIITWLKENWDWLSKILIIIGVFAGVIVVINTIATAFGAISAAVSFLLGPIGLVVLAIAALIAIGVLVWQNWQKIADFAVEIWNGIKEFFTGLGTWFSELWAGMVETAKEIWNTIVEFFTNIVIGIQEKWTAFTSFWTELWNTIITIISGVWQTILEAVSIFIQNVIVFFQPLVEVVQSIINLWLAIFNLGFQAILALVNLVITGVSLLWQGLVTIVNNVWLAILNFFTPVIMAIQNTVQLVTSAISLFFQTAWQFIVSVWGAASIWFSTIFNAISAVVSGVFSAIGGFASNAWATITNVFGTIGSWFGGVFEGAKTAVSGIFDSFGNIASGAWNAIKNTFGGVYDFFVNAFSGVKDFIDNIFGGISSTINGVSKAINGISGTVSKMFKGSLVSNLPGLNLNNASQGMTQNSVSTDNRTYNTFNVSAGGGDVTNLARAIRREFNTGRA